MKKIILLASAALMMVGCEKQNSDGSYVLEKNPDNTNIGNNPVLIVIDTCEYISWSYGLSHKGNCRFCKERRQKELEELVIKLKEK